MAVLYINQNGKEVRTHSFSSGSTFNSCARKYYLQKVKGWRPKERSAALEFGKAVEDSIQYFHENNLESGSGVEFFKRRWAVYEDDKELVYKATEKNFSNLLRAGAEILKLYEILLPSLPISHPVFQVNYSKPVFPDTNLGDLMDQGYVDIISSLESWEHPLLPKIPRGEGRRQILIDVKTAGKELNITADMLALEPQLRRYGWLSGLRTVAFLLLIKSVWDAYEKGKDVTFLTTTDNWTAGDKAVVFRFDEENQTALLTTHEGLQRIKGLLEEIKGKGSTERKDTLIAGLIKDNDILSVSVDDITKQKLQFLAVHLTEEDVLEAGNQVAQEIVDIHAANERGVWLQRPGVRFPDQKCTWCQMRGICTRNNKLRDELLVQITDGPRFEEAEEVEEDWLSEMEG